MISASIMSLLLGEGAGWTSIKLFGANLQPTFWPQSGRGIIGRDMHESLRRTQSFCRERACGAESKLNSQIVCPDLIMAFMCFCLPLAISCIKPTDATAISVLLAASE
jgi:hypothetical protein